MRALQKLDFSGHLDRDTDPTKLDPNNYTDARNIQPLTKNTESTRDHIPMLGNVLAFELGSVTTQNKTYRLFTEDKTLNPDTFFGGFSTLLFFSNGVQFPVTHTIKWTRNQSIPAQASFIQSSINTLWGLGAVATVTAGTTYVDITLTLITGYDFTISATNASTAAGVAMTFNTLKEAYDTTLTGDLRAIGSYDLLGDLYIWSTTGVNLPLKKTLTVLSISLLPVGARQLYKIIFTSEHKLSIGQSVNLLGNTGSAIDGTWIVSSFGFATDSIVLEDYFSKTLPVVPPPAVPPTTITATLYAQSIGEIGVAQYTASTDTWLYTRLGRTKQWGFRTKKQCDTYCEQSAIKSSLYWTDDFNVPRVIYNFRKYDISNNLLPYDPTIDNDRIISTINSTGFYTYESILQESSLQLNESGARILFKQQLQSGGQVTSGNWRYAIRFLTESLTATTLSDVTNPVNVYSASTSGSATLIIGDQPDTVTPKINQLEVTGILPGLFKFVELIGVNYVGDSIAGYNIRREALDSTQTSIILNHTGTETNTSDFDLGLLNQIFEQIATAKNIAVIDKRMILSNLTTKQRIDFSAWALTFKHSVLRKSITSVQDKAGATSDAAHTTVFGEYQNPVNVNTNMGYMHNETYRFSFKGHFKGGGFTDNFHIDDIVINCNPTQNRDIFGNAPSGSINPDSRRIAGLTNFDLTDGGAFSPSDPKNVFVPYVNFSNIDFSFKIDGTPVRDIFDFIEIERAEVNPTILACGYVVPSISFVFVSNPNNYNARYNDGNPSVVETGEFPLVSGRTLHLPSTSQNPSYGSIEFNAFGRRREYAAFYSPDIQFGHRTISLVDGDKMINFGNPAYVRYGNAINNSSLTASNYAQYGGAIGASFSIPPVSVSLAEVAFLGFGLDHTFASGVVYRKRLRLGDGTLGINDPNYSICSIEGSLIMRASAGFNVLSAAGQYDGGFYYNQYYRPKAEQYGNKNLTTYITCGHRMNISASVAGAQNTDVFGGDTFTQMNYSRHRGRSVFGDTFPGFIAPATAVTGFAGGISFYCQNKINAQMKCKFVGQISNIYPGVTTAAWLDTNESETTESSFGSTYQEGYTIRNQVQSDIAFNADLEDDSDQPARIRWSAIKPQGSPSDQYRTYLPLDFHDLDQTNGEIVHHANGNGELLTWQQRAFMRQYFNTRGTLEVKGITEILIGDGSVMSRDGVTVSRLGSKHKWAVIRGKSVGGNDVFYWLNTELKKALRFGYDGTVSIADIKGMQSFFANNLTWADLADTPADGKGICGTWDDRYANVIWTARAKRDIYTGGTPTPSDAMLLWDNSTTFTLGRAVSHTPTNFSTFEKTGEIFISKLSGNLNNLPAVYLLPQEVANAAGTTTITITTLGSHLLLTGDQVKFTGFAGINTVLNNVFFTVTFVNATQFTITSTGLTATLLSGGENITEIIPKWWTLVPHTDGNFYNEYTLLFNEFKNAFICDATFKPKNYLKWTDTFLSPRPISPEHKIYLHNKGKFLWWYEDAGVKQTERAYIEGVINAMPEETKNFEAIGVDSEITPIRFEFKTKQHQSFLTQGEFTTREDSSFSPIKKDSTTSGINSSNTSTLFGKFLKAKMFFEIDTYQKLSNFIIKFRINARIKSK